MGSVVELYEALASAPDERARARLIAAAFERLEERYPHLPDLVTHQQLRETEVRLQKEIEQVRADLSLQIERLRGEVKTEIEQLRAEVKTDIAQLRGELRETELRLQKEIEQLRGEVTTAIEHSRNTLLMLIIPLMFAQVGALAALVKLL
jgi:gas vesicle protein